MRKVYEDDDNGDEDGNDCTTAIENRVHNFKYNVMFIFIVAYLRVSILISCARINNENNSVVLCCVVLHLPRTIFNAIKF